MLLRDAVLVSSAASPGGPAALWRMLLLAAYLTLRLSCRVLCLHRRRHPIDLSGRIATQCCTAYSDDCTIVSDTKGMRRHVQADS